jgi:zinc protease
VKNGDQWSVISGRWSSRCARFVLAGFLLLLMPQLHAQQEKPWEKIPVPPLHQFKPQQPKRIALKNGIVLFLQEDHELPFVSGSVLIPAGSRDEDPAKVGLIDLYGQAWRTSGTAEMNGDAMDDLLESKAAHIETAGDDVTTSLAWDSLKADTDVVYDLAMDLLFHPKFDEQKLRLAQQQEATGIVRRNDDEGQIAGREAARLIYGASNDCRSPSMARQHNRRKAHHQRQRRLRFRGHGSPAAQDL